MELEIFNFYFCERAIIHKNKATDKQFPTSPLHLSLLKLPKKEIRLLSTCTCIKTINIIEYYDYY